MLVTPNRKLLAVIAAVILLLGVVPLVSDVYFLKLFTRIVILAIFAMSLDLLIGYTGLVSFGHAAFFGFSAYMLHLISPEYDPVNALWALPLCVLAAGGVAAAIGALSVRTKGIYFIMVTLAFAQMLFFLFHDSKFAGGSDGAFIYFKPVVAVFGLTLLDMENRIVFYYLCLAFLVLTYLLLLMVLRSPFGQVIQGIKVNEQRMLSLGYNTYIYKLVSFIIAGMFAGLAGFLFAAIDGFIAPQLLSWSESGIAMMVVILGGMGTLFGPILGAIGYVGLEEVLKSHDLVGFVADYWQIPMGLFVIAVVLFLPNGLGGAVARLVAPPPADASGDEDD